jgi:hypothetical protein
MNNNDANLIVLKEWKQFSPKSNVPTMRKEQPPRERKIKQPTFSEREEKEGLRIFMFLILFKFN